MAPPIFIHAALVVAVIAFLAGMFGTLCLGRLLMHLRKLEPAIYESLGGSDAAMFGGTLELLYYLWHRKFLESPHREIRAWGIRHNASGRVMFVALICVAAILGYGHLTMRASSP